MREVERLWAEHRGAAFPDASRGDEVLGVDLTLLDADIAGCVSTFLGSGHRLDETGTSVLERCSREVRAVIPHLAGHAQAYFARLEKVLDLVLSELRRSAPGRGRRGDAAVRAQPEPGETNDLLQGIADEAIGQALALDTDDAEAANRHHDRLVDHYRELRASSRGRSILDLLDHPAKEVQLYAATYALEFEPKRAKSILKQLSKQRGHLGFTAGTVLEEWKHGRLTFPE